MTSPNSWAGTLKFHFLCHWAAKTLKIDTMQSFGGALLIMHIQSIISIATQFEIVIFVSLKSRLLSFLDLRGDTVLMNFFCPFHQGVFWLVHASANQNEGQSVSFKTGGLTGLKRSPYKASLWVSDFTQIYQISCIKQCTIFHKQRDLMSPWLTYKKGTICLRDV